MNWDMIGAIGEIAGALAVVASLVYLARQIGFSAILRVLRVLSGEIQETGDRDQWSLVSGSRLKTEN